MVSSSFFSSANFSTTAKSPFQHCIYKYVYTYIFSSSPVFASQMHLLRTQKELACKIRQIGPDPSDFFSKNSQIESRNMKCCQQYTTFFCTFTVGSKWKNSTIKIMCILLHVPILQRLKSHFLKKKFFIEQAPLKPLH